MIDGVNGTHPFDEQRVSTLCPPGLSFPVRRVRRENSGGPFCFMTLETVEIRIENEEFVFFFPAKSIDHENQDIYWIPGDRIDTAESLIRWIHHIAPKTWCDGKVIESFIRVWSKIHGFSPYNP